MNSPATDRSVEARLRRYGSQLDAAASAATARSTALADRPPGGALPDTAELEAVLPLRAPGRRRTLPWAAVAAVTLIAMGVGGAVVVAARRDQGVEVAGSTTSAGSSTSAGGDRAEPPLPAPGTAESGAPLSTVPPSGPTTASSGPVTSGDGTTVPPSLATTVPAPDPDLPPTVTTGADDLPQTTAPQPPPTTGEPVPPPPTTAPSSTLPPPSTLPPSGGLRLITVQPVSSPFPIELLDVPPRSLAVGDVALIPINGVMGDAGTSFLIMEFALPCKGSPLGYQLEERADRILLSIQFSAPPGPPEACTAFYRPGFVKVPLTAALRSRSVYVTP